MLAIALIVAIVPALVMGRRRRRRQDAAESDELHVFLEETGWRRVEPDADLCRRWSGAPFGFGARPEVADVIRGRLGGCEAVAFDYSVSLSGDRAHYQLCCVTLPASLAPLEVEPKSAAEVARPASLPRIQLGDDEFTRRFAIFGPDPAFARDVLSAPVRAKLLALPDCAWRIEADTLLAFAAEPLSPTWLRAAAAMLTVITESVPERVWRDHGLAASGEGGSSAAPTAAPTTSGEAGAGPGWTPAPGDG